ncbi:MAG: hypothetical protein AAFX94_20105 [Myxococcota bacterium]
MIRVVDATGKQLERPALIELLEPLLEKHLGDVEVLQPLVVKVPLRGPAWLYAYVDRERGLRVQIPAGLKLLVKEIKRHGWVKQAANLYVRRNPVRINDHLAL